MANDLISSQAEDPQEHARAKAQAPIESQPLTDDQAITQLQRTFGDMVNQFNIFKTDTEKKVREIVNEADETNKTVKDTKDLMVLGFKILLFTSGLALIGVFSIWVTMVLDLKNSSEQLQSDKYQFQQNEINFLMKIATPSSKIIQ